MKPKYLLLHLLSLILITRSIIPLIKLISQFPLNDFSVYIDGTRATLIGKNPYELWFFDRYNYSPSATLFFLPFTWVSTNTAEYIFTAISIASLYLIIIYSLASLSIKPHWSTKLFLFALALRLFPVRLTLSLGQVNLIVLCLIMAAFYFQQKKPLLAGGLLGVAAVIKLTPAPLIIYFLLKQKYRLVISFLATIIVINFTSIIKFSLPLTQYYYIHVLPELNSRLTQGTINATYMNQSITALLARFKVFNDSNNLIRYIISVFTLLLLAIRHKKLSDFQIFSLLLIILTIFFPIFVWQHHYVVVIPLLIMLFAYRQWLLTIIFYLFFNLYFHNSGQAIIAHPLIATHFLTLSLLLVIINLLWIKPDENQAKTEPTQSR